MDEFVHCRLPAKEFIAPRGAQHMGHHARRPTANMSSHRRLRMGSTAISAADHSVRAAQDASRRHRRRYSSCARCNRWEGLCGTHVSRAGRRDVRPRRRHVGLRWRRSQAPTTPVGVNPRAFRGVATHRVPGPRPGSAGRQYAWRALAARLAGTRTPDPRASSPRGSGPCPAGYGSPPTPPDARPAG